MFIAWCAVAISFVPIFIFAIFGYLSEFLEIGKNLAEKTFKNEEQ